MCNYFQDSVVVVFAEQALSNIGLFLSLDEHLLINLDHVLDSLLSVLGIVVSSIIKELQLDITQVDICS